MLSALHLLIDATKDPGVVNALGEPPIITANHAGMKEATQLLIDRGAALTFQDKWGYDAILDAVLSDAHDNLTIFLDLGLASSNHLFDGKTILHIAALNSDRKTIEILSNGDFAGTNPNARDQAGNTALDYMRQRRRNEEVWEPFCALLLKAEADNLSSHHDDELTGFSNDDVYHDAQEQISHLGP
jgi:ankyrin repeat protein